MLVWDLATDEIVPGQWIKGRVYEKRSDVSPDGRYFVGAFTNYSSKPDKRDGTEDGFLSMGWTAVSRPPYFTALALWFTGGAWNGGGIWTGPRALALNNSCVWKERLPVRRPVRARLLNLPPSENEPIYSMLLRKRGWTEVSPLQTKLLNPGWRAAQERLIRALEDPSLWSDDLLGGLEEAFPRFAVEQEGVWERPFGRGVFQRVDRYRGEVWRILADDGTTRREWTLPEHRSFWLETDPNGWPVFAEQGRLYRWRGFPDGSPRLVADLNPQKFEEVPPPPWAKEW
ncbi:MAG: hypothetical protein WHU10_07965 [Fimbriimonadales bacterium]